MSQSKRNDVIQSIKRMLKTVGYSEETIAVTQTTMNNERKRRRNKGAKRDDITVDDVLKEFVSNDNSADDNNDPYDDVIEYFKNKVSYQDVLSWWTKHSYIYPQLSRLAPALLSIPASSASSERILEARRQQMSSESLDSLVFVRNFS